MTSNLKLSALKHLSHHFLWRVVFSGEAERGHVQRLGLIVQVFSDGLQLSLSLTPDKTSRTQPETLLLLPLDLLVVLGQHRLWLELERIKRRHNVTFKKDRSAQCYQPISVVF